MDVQGTCLPEIMCKGREMPSGDYELFAYTPEDPDGAWMLKDYPSGVTHLRYVCPCGCRGFGEIPVTAVADAAKHSWAWDGNREAPTLSPSIFRAHSCGWHGFFVAGVWRGL